MKNLHTLPTDKPSRIYLIKSNKKLGITSDNPEFTENFGGGTQNQNIYITSDEEIKEGDYVFQINFEKTNTQVIKCETEFQTEIANDKDGSYTKNKIILTTDQDLIKDGVQAIDNEFLEWFVKNPSCEEVETKLVEQRCHLTLNDWVDEDKNGKFPISIAGAFRYRKIYKIIIPQEEPKQETLEEVKDLAYYKANAEQDYLQVPISVLRYISQLEQGYSEEEVLAFGKSCFYKGFEKSEKDDANCYTAFREEIGGLIEQFKNK